MLALEWPLGLVAGTAIHRSLEVRLAIIPLVALASSLIYQGTDPAMWYLIGMVVYFVAYSEGEVSFIPAAFPPRANLTKRRSSQPRLGHYPSAAARPALQSHDVTYSISLSR